MKNYPNVTVCGCGSGGLAMAADIALLGCRVNLYEFREFANNLDPIRGKGGVELTGKTNSGKTGLSKFNVITSDPQEVLQGSDVVFVNVPAMVVERIVEDLAPYLAKGQMLVVTTGYWASLRCRKILEKSGSLGKIVFVEEHIMPYLSRKIGPAQAHIFNYKRDIRIAAWPATHTNTALGILQTIYPQMIPSRNILENNLQPGNPAVHAQINIPKAEFFFERSREFRFYAEVSLCASKLADAFDEERRRLAHAFGLETPTYQTWFNDAYLYPGKNLYEIYGNVTCEHAQRWGTDAGNRRVLQEDLCYGFVPMEQLAGIAGVEVPVTSAMIEMIRIFSDFDYRSNGLKLEQLGMAGMNREQILAYVNNGTE
jgi:opine dehydrogenase